MKSQFAIRKATIEDAGGMARVRVNTWRVAYRGILPDEVLDNLSCEATARRWEEILRGHEGTPHLALVAEDPEAGITGISMGGPERGGGKEYQAEIYVLYVLPEHQGKGIGRRLVQANVAHFLEQGWSSMLIWVLAQNPYRAFYAAMGGKHVIDHEIEIGGRMYPEAGYGWDNLRGTRVAPPLENS